MYIAVFVHCALPLHLPLHAAASIVPHYSRAVEQVLADGNSEQFGNISAGVIWQATGWLSLNQLTNFSTIQKLIHASGELTKGCPTTSGLTITDCYGISLTSNASDELDPGFLSSPRQRVEFRIPTQTNGTTRTYTWKHYLDPSVGTSTHFFHLMQIFDQVAGSPIVTLDAANKAITIDDNVRTPSCGSSCPTTQITNYSGKTTLHRLKITAGPSGSMQYTVTDFNTKASIVSYNVPSGVFGSTQI
jgi:hypothetical protein